MCPVSRARLVIQPLQIALSPIVRQFVEDVDLNKSELLADFSGDVEAKASWIAYPRLVDAGLQQLPTLVSRHLIQLDLRPVLHHLVFPRPDIKRHSESWPPVRHLLAGSSMSQAPAPPAPKIIVAAASSSATLGNCHRHCRLPQRSAIDTTSI